MTFMAEVLAEQDLWYHGRPVKEQKFDVAFTGKGHDQEGPGFYFTRKKGDAAGYASPAGIVMTVKLQPRKLVPLDKSPKKTELLKVIKAAPDLKNKLQDWAESPQEALALVLDIYMKKDAKDAFESVWYDFYRDDAPKFLQKMIDIGYDGHKAERAGKGSHIVIYNPDAIEIQEVEDYKK